MKSTKKLTTLLATLFLFVGLLAGSCITVSAAASVPSKIRIYPNSVYESSIYITLDKPGDVIKNIKTSSKNLKAKETRIYIDVDYDGYVDSNSRSISLYATKTGKYTVSFDIYGANNKKKSSKKVTVQVDTSPLKSITFDGKAIGYTTTKSSGKLKVTMNKGYTLKKIEVGKYVKKKSNGTTQTNMKYTKIKNNAKITLSKVPYQYDSESGTLNPKAGESQSYYKSWEKEIYAPTEIKITYYDKFMKQTQTTYYSITKLLI